jgi:hypothetical protein
VGCGTFYLKRDAETLLHFSCTTTDAHSYIFTSFDVGDSVH